MSNRWTHSNKAVYNLGYHLIWCPKYRRKVLVGELKDRLIELINEKSKKIDISVEIMKIMSDHIHLFVKSSPVNSPHYIVQQIKGYSSNILRKEFKHLKKNAYIMD
jgi:putative transposase